jgi:hypothetical protein
MVGVKRFPPFVFRSTFGSFPWVTRFSSRSPLGAPHDGVRKVERRHLFRDLGGAIGPVRFRTLNAVAPPFVPKGTSRSAVADLVKGASSPLCGLRSLLGYQAAKGRPSGSKVVPSTHRRCSTTPSLRARATRALAMPRRLAIFRPQLRRAEDCRHRISNECAAS